MKREYIAIIRKVAAKPRRKSHGGAAASLPSLPGAVIPESGGGGAAPLPDGWHTHSNLSTLEEISTDKDGYLYLTQTHTDEQKEGAVITTEKVKAGHADQARDLTPDSPVREEFLSRMADDTAHGLLTFEKGAKFGKNARGGMDGSGGTMEIDKDENSVLSVDYINVRKSASYREITIQELKHIGGELALTAAAMQCTRVEWLDKAGQVMPVGGAEGPYMFRCYFETKEDGRFQYFQKGDYARCNAFSPTAGNGWTSTRYYWRKVEAVGENYIDLSTTVCDGSTYPEAGDNIVQLGNDHDVSRQSAIILSAVSATAPSITSYHGINDFDLPSHVIKEEGFSVTDGIYHSNIYGDWFVGDKGRSNYAHYDSARKMLEMKARVQIDGGIGGENLLRNTGFAGNYESAELDGRSELTPDSELYSPNMEHWTGDGVVIENGLSRSGYACRVGSIEQMTDALPQGDYCLSWKCSAPLKVTVDGIDAAAEGSGRGAYYHVLHHRVDGPVRIGFGGTSAVLYEVKLERGRNVSDWCPNVHDKDEGFDGMRGMWYLQQAIREGSTDILGGLILSSLIKLGNYKDGQMQQVTAGMSGLMSTGNDVAFWAGGSLEKAVKSMGRIKRGEPLTDKDWNELIGFAVTHGGDAFFKGYVYALGGVFRGSVYAENGIFKGEVKAENGYFKGLVRNGSVHITPDNIGEYTITTKMGDLEFNFDKISPTIYFEGDFGGNDTLIKMPTDKDAREFVGKDLLIYNNALNFEVLMQGNIYIVGEMEPNLRQLKPGYCCKLHCDFDFTRGHQGGEEIIIWEYSQGKQMQ